MDGDGRDYIATAWRIAFVRAGLIALVRNSMLCEVRANEEECMQRRILFIPFLLLFALCANGYQQPPANDAAISPDEIHARMLGLMRSIITVEVSEQSEHDSYATWPMLLQHQSSYFNDWLNRFWPAETPQRFSDPPEVLPGLKLRLTLSADGRSYMLLLQDVRDKQGFAFVGDESGIIRESRYVE